MLRCPHCLEEIKVSVALGGAAPERCPVCTRSLDTSIVEDAPADYGVHAPTAIPGESSEVKEYVRGLEARARAESRRKPYHRARPKSNLIAALVLIGGAGLSLAVSAANAAHLLDFFINGMLPAFLCLMCAALCLFFWSR